MIDINCAFTFPGTYYNSYRVCHHSSSVYIVPTRVLPFTGLGNAVVTVIRTEGFPALYKGLAPTLVGIAPYAAINFASYDLMKRQYYGDGSDRR